MSSDENPGVSGGDPVKEIVKQLVILETRLDEGVEMENGKMVGDAMRSYITIGAYLTEWLDLRIRTKHPEIYLDFMRNCTGWFYLVGVGETANFRKAEVHPKLRLIIDNLGKAPLVNPKGKNDLLGIIVKNAWIDLQYARNHEYSAFRPDSRWVIDEDCWVRKVMELADFNGNERKWGNFIFDYLFYFFCERQRKTDFFEWNYLEMVKAITLREYPEGIMDEISWESDYHKKCPFVYSVFYPSTESRRKGGISDPIKKERNKELKKEREILKKKILNNDSFHRADVGSFLKETIDKEFEPIKKSIMKRYAKKLETSDSDGSVDDGIFRSEAIDQICDRIRTYNKSS